MHDRAARWPRRSVGLERVTGLPRVPARCADAPSEPVPAALSPGHPEDPPQGVVPARFRPWVWWGHGTLASFPPPPACSPAQGAGPSATLACPTSRIRAQCGLPGMMGEQGGWRGADVGP